MYRLLWRYLATGCRCWPVRWWLQREEQKWWSSHKRRNSWYKWWKLETLTPQSFPVCLLYILEAWNDLPVHLGRRRGGGICELFLGVMVLNRKCSEANSVQNGHTIITSRMFFAGCAHPKADLDLVFDSLFQNKGLFLQRFQVSCNSRRGRRQHLFSFLWSLRQ